MTSKKWLIASCLILSSWFVQAVTPEEEQAQLDTANMYNVLVIEHVKRGQFQRALRWAEKAFNIRREILGDKHPYSLESRNNLAAVYQKLGRLDDALPLLKTGYLLVKELAGEKHPITLKALGNLATIYREIGRLDDALSLFEQCASLMTEVLGKKHPETLSSLNGLAVVYQELGRLKEALPLFESVYSLKTEVLGEKHPSTLTGLNNLAGIYRQLGRLNEVLPLAQKSYRVGKEVLGEKHPDRLKSINNLAVIYQQLGRFSDALPLFETSYRLFQELLGESHPLTLTSLLNLAEIYHALGDLNKALPLYEKSYFLTEEVFAEHPSNNIQVMNGLASIYQTLGRFEEARQLLEKSSQLGKQWLGDKHPETLVSINGLALVYQKLGRLKEALPLFESVYSLKTEVLGEKHQSTLISLNNLAGIYLKLGRLNEVLPLAQKSYRVEKEVFGEEHPNTLTSLNNLAVIYHDLGRLDEALPLMDKSYRLTKKVRGEKHPDTFANRNGLASIYQDLGRLDEALRLFEKNYLKTLEVLPDNKHPTNVTNLNNLALCYQDLGRVDEALPLFEKAYRLSKDVLGEKHPETLISLNNIATIYQELGRLGNALSSFETAYFLNKEVFGEKHPETLTSLSNLALFYQQQGQFEEALPWSKKAYHLSAEVFGEKHPKTVLSLNNLALNYQELKQLDKALPLGEKAYRFNQDVLGEKHPETLTSLRNLAIYYSLTGQFQKSVQHFEQFVAGVESLRGGDLSVENRQALFKQKVTGYIELSYLYINQSRPVDAFRLAEMSKARTLLESIAAQLAAQQSVLSADEQLQLQDYEARLAFLNNRIAKALENNRLEAKLVLESEKNQLVSQFNQFHQQLIAKYPKYAQLSDVEIVGAKEGAKYLPTDAVLISYLVVHDNQVFAFTLQSDGTLTAHNLGQIPNLEENVKDYRYRLSLTRGLVLSGKPKKDIDTLSRELGQQLLEPIKHIINEKKRWIISPNGLLALIPFETLRVDGKEQPVIAQHQVSYVQSLSVLKLLQERDKEYQSIQNRGTLLAMGAPLYQQQSASRSSLPKEKTSELRTGETSAAVETVNPSTVDFNIANRLAMRGDYGRAFRQIGQMRWLNLPGTLTEISELEALFKETAPAIYIKEQATEAQLQRLNQQHELANYRYLVFAAHGYLSTEVPALSAIVLGQVNNPPGIDGYVSASEWQSYDLKSDLMVLSACQTGRGEVVGGEGVMGLPYAFYVAGNKNTLLTLWEISDEVSAEFVTSFFNKLKDGIAQVDALTATKREFLNKGGRYSDPAYWAAFLLYGL